MTHVMELTVNDVVLAVSTAADQPLLHVLRDELGLTGCKIGCAEGVCGACTVLVDDRAVRSCITPVGEVGLRRVRTIEGLEQGGRLHPLQQAFLDNDAMQCGYCIPGMIMSACALLAALPQPTATEIIAAMQGNICRCGTYSRIIRAVQQAAEEIMREGRAT
jgi:aerobic-type carbon monoxide dehydrogenase small subunit (CoxS/CutS family)